MPKIIDKIREHRADPSKGPFFSMEFFPPKTIAGVENLYTRIERMISVMPLFIDITWGAGGATEELSLAIAEYAQKYLCVDVLLHLTCTNLTKTDLRRILTKAKAVGIKNVLALRGDPLKGALRWEPNAEGCSSATELVQFIKAEFGDYFGIAVAGFPEGHPDSRAAPGPAATQGPGSVDEFGQYIRHLKTKVDAGADFILTQFFYDTKKFLNFTRCCRAEGITCPIIPGIMPIHTYSSFLKMTKFCCTSVPDAIWTGLATIKENDDEVKQFGVNYCAGMIRELMETSTEEGCDFAGGFHFYTLNLEKGVMSILNEIHITDNAAARRQLPWRGSRCDLKGTTEEVRPINWSNRPKSYIQRTVTWDEFPNGRWGDGRSPAFGELGDLHFFRPAGSYSKEDYLSIWGEAPVHAQEVYEVFARYVEGKIPLLPWCETELQTETSAISQQLSVLNRMGFLTINSQPAVNGMKSDHPVFGWGGVGGYVYQKAYVEFFVSPENLQYFTELMPKYDNLNFHAINESGLTHDNGHKGVTALTWGVFPNREILQPTIFDADSFRVWSKESFQLWREAWANLYDDETESSELLHTMIDTYYLVAIIDNDYVGSDLYSIFREVMAAMHDRKAGAASAGLPLSHASPAPGTSTSPTPPSPPRSKFS